MKNIFIIVSLLSLIIMTSGCEPKIDGRSTIACQKSLELMGEKHSDAERSQLDMALQVMGETLQHAFLAERKRKANGNSNGESAELTFNVNEKLCEHIHEKSFEQLIAIADSDLQSRIHQKKSDLESHIKALEAKRKKEKSEDSNFSKADQEVLTSLEESLQKMSAKKFTIANLTEAEWEELKSPVVSLDVTADKFNFDFN